MSVSFPTLNYTFPVPKFADGKPVTSSEGLSEGSTIKDICDAYKGRFGLPEDKSDDYDYGQYINTLFSEVNAILGKEKKEDYYKFDKLGTSGFYRSAQTISVTIVTKDKNGKETTETITKRIDEICQEGFLAYRFYLKEISSRLQRIDAAIKKGQAALQAIGKLGSNSPEIIINGQAHFYITELEIQDKFIHEELQEFLRYYRYNNDTKQWDAVLAENYDSSQVKSILGEGLYDMPLGVLRNLKVKVIHTDSQVPEEKKNKQLTAFYELTLLDRLRYIRLYYELIIGGATDYSIFPAESDIGYPCLPDIESTSPTEDTKKLGALELFYLGYLIERDGPINAVASFFEVKVEALRNNISLMSKKIEALNVYLDFINRGMDLLNQSQNKGNARIPNGSILTLTYLCGQNMYNLFETEDGTKCLVLERADKKGYILVEANEDGKNFLIGNNAFDSGTAIGNGVCGIASYINGLFPLMLDEEKYDGNEGWATSKTILSSTENESGFKVKTTTISNFVLPTQIEVTSVLPGSVQRYNEEKKPTVYDGTNSEDKDSWKNVVESWTTAFSNKTQYINTAIDTINTDVTVDRSKVDTFDSLASTFRSRAHDAYLNTVSNIR